MGNSVAWKLGDYARDHSQNDSGDERLKRDPRHAERGLFVSHLDIPLDQHPKEIAIIPKLAKIQRGPAFGRANTKGRCQISSRRDSGGRWRFRERDGGRRFWAHGLQCRETGHSAQVKCAAAEKAICLRFAMWVLVWAR